MKKILFVLVLVFSITMTFAQKNVRQTASNFLKEGKLDKALENINICLQDPTMTTDAKAWLIRGNIYLEIYNKTQTGPFNTKIGMSKKEVETVAGKPQTMTSTQYKGSKSDQWVYKGNNLYFDESGKLIGWQFESSVDYSTLDPDPLKQALDSYKKVIEFDPKKEYYEDVFAKLNWLHTNFFNSGVDNYNKKSYKESMLDFENAANTLSIVKIQDTISLFYAAVNANLAGEKAKQKQYYIELLNENAKSMTIYKSLADLYISEKDSANALKVIRAGKKIAPNNLLMTLSESNVYIQFNDVPKALSTLNIAAQKDSNNYYVFNAIGNNYQKIYEDTLQPAATRSDAYKRSEAAYLKAIKIKPDFYDVELNIASLYFNSAVPIALKANGLPLEQKDEYDRLENLANSYYKLALPYLKKADELQPNDLNTLNSLRQIYSSLGDTEDLKAVQAKIMQLRKK